MAEPEPENTVSQNTPDLKDVFKYGEIELTNRIGQFLTPGSGFRLGVAMGDTRMVNEYKRIGEQKFTRNLPLFTETFIKRHKAAFERQMYQQRGAPSAFSNKRPIRRIVSYDTKETDRGPVSEADYTKQMKAGMKN